MNLDVLGTEIVQAGFLQFEIVPGSIPENVRRLRQGLQQLEPPSGSVVVLPEMWATGFVYEQLAVLSIQIPELLVELNALASSMQIILAGSLPLMGTGENKGLLFNTLCFSGTGLSQTPGIAKQHLFSFWKEHLWFTPGMSPEPLSLPGGDLVGGLVCYDLRFPEVARLQCRKGATILIMSAEWPMARIEQWRILLQARAIENQAFVVAANSCGIWDGMQMGGHSMVIAPDGDILAEALETEASALVPLQREIQEELRQRFNSVAPAPWSFEDSEKIFSLDDLLAIVRKRRNCGQRVVFTNGCFDILHAGHVDYLQKARREGDLLIVGLNNDASICSIKGPQRPVNNEQNRARVLAALGCVDAIVLFAEDTPVDLIKALVPDVLVKGADWKEDEIAGAAEVKKNGGRVALIPFVSNESTSGIIDAIRSV